MKKTITTLLVGLSSFTFAQTPKLQISLTSHVEPAESFTALSSYTPVKDTLKRIVDIVHAKNAKYNMQLMPNFIQGALVHQSAATSTNDIIEYAYKIGGVPGNVVEIDPRYKTTTLYNIADVSYSINLTGAQSSSVVGGFVHFNQTGQYAAGDWTPYTTPITAQNTSTYTWKANIMWGAGSLPPHTKDANNYGNWKPRGKTDSIDFYCHDPAQTIWLQGNGCAWVLTPTTNVNQMIADIRSEATKIANGTYPSNKFYNGNLMINFKDFGTSTVVPTFQMPVVLSRVLDSINVLVSQGKAEFRTITQKQAAFAAWSASTGITYSQWKCGQTTTVTATCNMTGLEKRNADNFVISPNPTRNTLKIRGLQNNQHYTIEMLDALGRLFMKEETLFLNEKEINLKELKPGLYYIRIGSTTHKVIKE